MAVYTSSIYKIHLHCYTLAVNNPKMKLIIPFTTATLNHQGFDSLCAFISFKKSKRKRNSIYNSIKKKKIPRNKFNKRSSRLYSENYKTLWKEIF